MNSNRTIPKMAVPKALRSAARTDGGMNLFETAGHIEDTESPKLLNFWRKDGMLKLRPGLRKLAEQGSGRVLDVYPRGGRSILLRKTVRDGVITEEVRGIYIAAENGIFLYDGERLERVADTLVYKNGWQSVFHDYGFEKCVFIPSGSTGKSTLNDQDTQWEVTGETVYLVGSGNFLVISPQVFVYQNPSAVSHVTAVCLAGKIEPYVPVLYEQCAPSGEGIKVEEHNILTGHCIQKFTTDDTTCVYQLCDRDIDDELVVAEFEDSVGSHYFFTFPQGHEIAVQNSISAILNRTAGTIWFSKQLPNIKVTGKKNNLVVSYSKTVYTSSPVSCCTSGLWYDGGAQKGSGCNRMFFSGFADQPNRIYFSETSHPLYFPQNNFFDIGVPADPITAFGIQYDILVIFKKNSIYSLVYTNTAAAPDFTVKEIHSYIGCDMPATVQLCANKLLWGSSADGIYALQSTTIKDERAVRLVSKNIGAKLLSLPRKDLQAASAASDGTSYLLLAGGSAFVLNYENLRLKSSELPEGAAWFYWSLPQSLSGAFRYGAAFAASAADGTVFVFDEKAADDYGQFFDACWRSKSFDFGAPDRLKKLCRFMLNISCAAPVKLEVRYGDGDCLQSCGTVTIGGSIRENALVFHPAAGWKRRVSLEVKRADGPRNPFGIVEYSLGAVGGAQVY